MKIELKWQVLLVVSIGIFMSTLDGSILNIANPTIAQSMSVSLKQVQWVVTAYMLVITASLLFFGKLGDKIGGHRIFTYGFLIFSLGSFLCSLSPSLPFLIGARVIQGTGSSMMMATGMGIVSNTFPANERGKALGLTGSMVGIGNMTGPSLGGIIVANFGWPIIFLINVPIGLIGFFLAYRFLPNQNTNQENKGNDISGTLLFALSAILLVISLSTHKGINMTILGFSLLLFILFFTVEKRTSNPMLDFDVFKVKTFVYGNLMGFTAYFTQTFIIFLMPFYLERLLHFSPAYSGLLMTIPPVAMAITAPIAGNISDKLGSARLTSVAFLMLFGAHLTFSTLTADINLYKIIAGLMLTGIGMGTFGSPNNNSILGSIPGSKAGYAGGFISTVRNFSFSLGIAACVTIFTSLLNNYQQTLAYPLAYTQAVHHVYIISAFITLIGLFISLSTGKSRKITRIYY